MQHQSERTPTAQQGQQGHRLLQSQRPDHYQKEVSLTWEVASDGPSWTLGGRVDGIEASLKPDQPTLVEEIKTTYYPKAQLPPAQRELHRLQLQLYGAILSQQQSLTSLQLQLSYFKLDDESHYSFQSEAKPQALKSVLNDCTQRFSEWLKHYQHHIEVRNLALSQLEFPFSGFRPQQRQLSVTFYRDVREKRTGFYHAPTGLGKTMGVLFPALKHLGEGSVRQIFYLTAKNSGIRSVQQALQHLQPQQPSLRTLYLRSREHQCVCSDQERIQCHYQRDYYQRLQTAREQFAATQNFNQNDLDDLAQTHQLCPHQLGRDLMPWSDLVVADYNYVFDPQVRLTDYFQKHADRILLLVDEAHNLPDRARSMFSESLSCSDLAQLQQSQAPAPLVRQLKQLEKKLRRWIMEPVQNPTSEDQEADLDWLEQATARISTELLEWFNEQTWLLYPQALFQQIMGFIRFAQRLQSISDADRLIRDQEKRQVKLFCLDPAPRITQLCKRFHSAHFFSGSLLPLDYFIRAISIAPVTSQLALPSPFPPHHQRTLILPVNTRFQYRQHTLKDIADALQTLWSARPGRYLVALPSYEYLAQLTTLLKASTVNSEKSWKLLVQPEQNRPRFREQFLQDIREKHCLALVIAGGVFAEGIDLSDHKLSGVVIISTCMTPPSTESRLMQRHYDQLGLPGFDFAYRFPGLNRVLQTAGRLIRSEQDRGLVLLLDDRFLQPPLNTLLPAQWHPRILGNLQQLQREVEDFSTADV